MLDIGIHARLSRHRRWRRRAEDIDDITWYGNVPAPKTWLRITDLDADTIQIWSTGFDLLGEAAAQLNPERRGILRGQRLSGPTGIRLLYRGPGDLLRPAPKEALRS